MKYTVYGLLCPIEKKIKYIGCTKKHISKRLAGHVNDRASVRKYKWLQYLKSLCLSPTIKVFGIYDKEIAFKKEKDYIDLFKSLNVDIYNGLGKKKKRKVKRETLSEYNSYFNI